MTDEVLVLGAFLTLGCVSSEPSTPLAAFSGSFELHIGIAAITQGPDAPTQQLSVTLGGNFTAPDCPVLDEARVTVNGLLLSVQEPGGVTQVGGLFEATREACALVQFSLRFERVPAELERPVTVVSITDPSDSLRAELANVLAKPVLLVTEPGAGELRIGEEARVEVVPPLPDFDLSNGFVTFTPEGAVEEGSWFWLAAREGELTLLDNAAVFVVPEIQAGPGTLLLQNQSFRPHAIDCSEFVECELPEGDDTLTVSAAVR